MTVDKAITPSILLSKVKSLLEGSFRTLFIKGEISNLSSSATGHYYFNLVDENASISVALFRGDSLRNPIIKSLKNGDEIIITGPMGVYTKRGTFQVLAKTVQKVGTGDLKEQFELLKKRLAGEGLFDLDNKKKIPDLPQKVAVITSPKGAALQDFLNIFRNRSIWMDVKVYPCVVQGEGAPLSIVQALHQAIQDKENDVIVITRGGGSIEDLWGFNDEGLAYEIFNCPIPIVSAVGHEVDFSICDLVSDLRVETPSAAATILTEGQLDIKNRLDRCRRIIKYQMNETLMPIQNSLSEKSPKSILNKLSSRISRMQRDLQKYSLASRFYELIGIHEIYFSLDDATKRIKDNLSRKLERFQNRGDKLNSLLLAFNPKNILNRGYTFIEINGKVVKSKESFSSLKSNEVLDLHFHDGTAEVFKK